MFAGPARHCALLCPRGVCISLIFGTLSTKTSPRFHSVLSYDLSVVNLHIFYRSFSRINSVENLRTIIRRLHHETILNDTNGYLTRYTCRNIRLYYVSKSVNLWTFNITPVIRLNLSLYTVYKLVYNIMYRT